MARYEPRVPDAFAFALKNRVLLLRNERGTGLDIALGGLPFEAMAVDRAIDVAFAEGVVLRICSAEDVIVMKAFAGRPTDWNDVAMICVRQGVEALDWGHIHDQLKPLADLKEAPEILERLDAIRTGRGRV